MSEPKDLMVPPLWQVWRNPIIWRYSRSRLRFKRTSFWLLLTLMITAWTVLQIYYSGLQAGVKATDAARLGLIPLVSIQGFILMLLGTGSVATGVVDEKLAGVLDYQRMAPSTPAHKIVGYLLGLPIREYAMFAVTVPFLLFIVWRGGISPLQILPVYLVFFSSVLLYHITGMAAGMVTERWRWAARLSQLFVILLYLVLPQFSHFGFVFFEYLTIRPVLAEHVRPLLGDGARAFLEGSDFLAARSVPFFTLTISGTVFSLMIQTMTMLLFITILWRKWVHMHRHPLSKIQTLMVFVLFQVLTFGNLWQILTTNVADLARERLRIPIPDEVIATAIPLAFVGLSGLLVVWLMLMVVPTWDALKQGERRRVNLKLNQVPWRWDESSAVALVAGLSFACGLLVIIVQTLLERADYAGDGERSGLLFLPVVFGGCLLIFGWTLAVFDRGRLMFSLLVLWTLPPLVASILGTAINDWMEPALWIAALSPGATLIIAGFFPYLEGLNTSADSFSRALYFGMFWMSCLSGVLFATWCVRYRSRLPKSPMPRF